MFKNKGFSGILGEMSVRGGRVPQLAGNRSVLAAAPDAEHTGRGPLWSQNDIAAMRNARQVAAAMAGPVLSKMGGPAFAPVARAPSFGPPGEGSQRITASARRGLERAPCGHPRGPVALRAGAPTGYGTYGGVASQPEPAWSGAPAQPAALPWSHSSGEHAAVGPAYGATPALGGGVEPQDRVMPEAEATAFGSRVPHGGMVHKASSHGAPRCPSLRPCWSGECPPDPSGSACSEVHRRRGTSRVKAHTGDLSRPGGQGTWGTACRCRLGCLQGARRRGKRLQGRDGGLARGALTERSVVFPRF